jgi:HEPN domain-containing protein
MYQKFVEIGSSFSKEILNKGIILYESNNKRKEWLDFAKADILDCERIIDADFLTNILAFRSQQAVEKCFKAFIEENNVVIPRIQVY